METKLRYHTTMVYTLGLIFNRYEILSQTSRDDSSMYVQQGFLQSEISTSNAPRSTLDEATPTELYDWMLHYLEIMPLTISA